jgi:hypothetical protein
MDYNYIKRAIRHQSNTKAKRRVMKVLYEAQDRFFEDRRRQERERMVDRETYTLSDAVEILKNAHYYIMRHTKGFWYNKAAMDASKILASKASDLRQEIKVELHRLREGIPN